MTNKTNKSQRVLVVDPNPDYRSKLGAALAQAGFDPVLAATGEQGLVMLRNRNRRVDWLITQADLPGLVDGSMLADEFHHVHPGRPVLYAVAPGEKGSATEQDTLLDTPLLPAQVVERVLALSKGQGVHASGLPRWAA